MEDRFRDIADQSIVKAVTFSSGTGIETTVFMYLKTEAEEGKERVEKFIHKNLMKGETLYHNQEQTHWEEYRWEPILEKDPLTPELNYNWKMQWDASGEKVKGLLKRILMKDGTITEEVIKTTYRSPL